MQIIKLNLASKNNQKNGFYLYIPIVFFNGGYYYCDSIKSKNILNTKDISPNSLKVTREINPAFYEANGLQNDCAKNEILTF